jgi:hypothetical protein
MPISESDYRVLERASKSTELAPELTEALSRVWRHHLLPHDVVPPPDSRFYKHLDEALRERDEARRERDEARADTRKALESSGADYEGRLANLISRLSDVAFGRISFVGNNEACHWAVTVLRTVGIDTGPLAANNLRVEIEFFEKYSRDWMKTHKGKWALVKALTENETTLSLSVSFWDSAKTAYTKGLERYGNVPMLLREVTEEVLGA